MVRLIPEMTKPLNTTEAVIEWVNNARRYATRLDDDEADALLAQHACRGG